MRLGQRRIGHGRGGYRGREERHRGHGRGGTPAGRSARNSSGTKVCTQYATPGSNGSPGVWYCTSDPCVVIMWGSIHPISTAVSSPNRPLALNHVGGLSRKCSTASRQRLLSFTENFMTILFKMVEPKYVAHPVLARALDILFILHADHEQNCGTNAMRSVGSSQADPFVCTAAAAAALPARSMAAPTKKSSRCWMRSARRPTFRRSSKR